MKKDRKEKSSSKRPKQQDKLDKQIAKLHERSLAYSYFAHIFSYPESPILQFFPSSPPDLTLLQADYTKLLLCKNNGKILLSPLHEASYTKAGRLSTPQELADIAGFYRAFGLQIKSGEDRPDHLSMELEFMAFLTLKEELARKEKNQEGIRICRRAKRLFLKDHLGCWLGALSTRLAKTLSPDSFYCQQAEGLNKLVQSEIKRLSVRVLPDMLKESGWEDTAGTSPADECPGVLAGCNIKSFSAKEE